MAKEITRNFKVKSLDDQTIAVTLCGDPAGVTFSSMVMTAVFSSTYTLNIVYVDDNNAILNGPASAPGERLWDGSTDLPDPTTLLPGSESSWWIASSAYHIVPDVIVRGTPIQSRTIVKNKIALGLDNDFYQREIVKTGSVYTRSVAGQWSQDDPQTYLYNIGFTGPPDTDNREWESAFAEPNASKWYYEIKANGIRVVSGYITNMLQKPPGPEDVCTVRM